MLTVSNFKQRCVQRQLRDLAALFARGLLSFSLPSRSEGAGNAGRRCAAAKSVHVVATVTPETPGIPRAMVYSLLCAPRRSGSFATVTPEKLASQELDTSVEMSGPHDLAVRSNIARLARRYVHRIPPLRP